MPTLHSVKAEVDELIKTSNKAAIHVDKSCLQEYATIDRCSKVLRSSHFVHIACHGIQNSQQALSSGFCLSDGILSVSRLMDLDLENAHFAFLSACETAKGDKKQPDQTVHLAAAMLFVGFKSVIATMW